MIFTLEKKPTSHLCQCTYLECQQKDIVKGDFRITIAFYGFRSSDARYYHPKCFFKEIAKLIGEVPEKDQDSFLKGVKFGIHLMNKENK